MLGRYYLQTDGIILHKRKINESDGFITLYSPEIGKITARAQGIYKTTSQFCGHLEIPNLCHLQLYKSPKGYTITQTSVKNSFKKIREDLSCSMLTLFMLEIFQKNISNEDSEQASEFFHLLRSTLENFENASEWFLLFEQFKLKFLSYAGVLPDIKSCSFCQKKWSEESEIQIDEDKHLRCVNCKKNSMVNPQKIESKITRLISYLLATNSIQKKILLTLEQRKDLVTFTNMFLYDYTNYQLKGEKILQETVF